MKCWKSMADGVRYVSFEMSLDDGRRYAQELLLKQWIQAVNDTPFISASWGNGDHLRNLKKKYIKELLLKQDKEQGVTRYIEYFDIAKQTLVQSKLHDTPELYWHVEEAVIDKIQLDWLDNKRMTEFMNHVGDYYANHLCVELPMPEDLAWCIDK